MKVLIAEDEADVCHVLAKKIGAAGYEVVAASDGDEAVALFRAEAPDILVLDINMPGRDGFEVLKTVRQEALPGKWHPVIIVSARGEIASMRQGFELEADHYLHKPCQPDEIISAIRLMESLIPLRH